MLTELHGLSARWYQAWLEKDATTVERLMAEDYLYVGPNGLALDRKAILAIIGSPSYRLDHGTRTEVVVRALGHEAAIVRHRFQGAGSFEGNSFTDDNRCVLVWEKQGGEWRIVLDQCCFQQQVEDASRPAWQRRSAEPDGAELLLYCVQALTRQP